MQPYITPGIRKQRVGASFRYQRRAASRSRRRGRRRLYRGPPSCLVITAVIKISKYHPRVRISTLFLHGAQWNHRRSTRVFFHLAKRNNSLTFKRDSRVTSNAFNDKRFSKRQRILASLNRNICYLFKKKKSELNKLHFEMKICHLCH